MPVPLEVRPATVGDAPVLERLWLMYRHDLSEFRGALPNPDASFRREWLDAALAGGDWMAYPFRSQDRPVGFAFVRGLTTPIRVLNSFFVVRGLRRSGVGLRAARDVIGRHPGAWEVAFQHDNPGATRFWRQVATQIAGTRWSEEVRPVPGQPDSPHDVWISFSTS